MSVCGLTKPIGDRTDDPSRLTSQHEPDIGETVCGEITVTRQLD